MFIFHYLNSSLQYLILKADCLNFYTLPRIQNLVIHLKLNRVTYGALCSGLLVLEMLTMQRSVTVVSKKANIVLKIRKGLPVGCKVHLRGTASFNFFEAFWVFILSRLNVTENVTFSKTINKHLTTFNLNILDVFAFKEIETLYFEFREHLTRLQIHINTVGCDPALSVILSQTLKLPVH